MRATTNDREKPLLSDVCFPMARIGIPYPFSYANSVRIPMEWPFKYFIVLIQRRGGVCSHKE